MSKQTSDFYAVVGEAMSNWQLLEDALAVTFEYCMQKHLGSDGSLTSTMTLRGLYFIPANTQTRIQMVQYAVKRMVADTALAQEWGTCSKEIDRLKVVRNAIAHSPLWGAEGEGVSELAPSIYNQGKQTVYSAEDIKAASEGFVSAADALAAFRRHLSEHLAQQ